MLARIAEVAAEEAAMAWEEEVAREAAGVLAVVDLGEVWRSAAEVGEAVAAAVWLFALRVAAVAGRLV